MNEILEFLVNYAVFPIAIICFGVGYVIKHFITKLPNNFIPLILTILGIFLNIWFNNWTVTFDIVLTGAASGLVSTGGFELVRNLVTKNEVKKDE